MTHPPSIGLTSSRVCTNQSSSHASGPPCIAHSVAILLHDYCAIYNPPATPVLYVVHQTILLIKISCQSELLASEGGRGRNRRYVLRTRPSMVVFRCRGIGPPSGIPSPGHWFRWPPIYIVIQLLQRSASPRARLRSNLGQSQPTASPLYCLIHRVYPRLRTSPRFVRV